jgi:hypothetical protein
MTTHDQAFTEPWQAEAFALAVALQDAGRLTRGAWATSLGAALASGADPDAPDAYHHAVVCALEACLLAMGEFDSATLSSRREAWAQAYERTPHGQPVRLASAATSAGAGTSCGPSPLSP